MAVCSSLGTRMEKSINTTSSIINAFFYLIYLSINVCEDGGELVTMMNRILNLPYCFCSSCPNPTEDVLVLQVTADCADDAECRPSSGEPCTNHTA